MRNKYIRFTFKKIYLTYFEPFYKLIEFYGCIYLLAANHQKLSGSYTVLLICISKISHFAC